MAPEQAVGDANVDQRADLYAWGVMAYELLAERHPFAMHTTPQALVTAHLTQQPTPIAPRAGTTIPPSVAALVMQCLAKDPAARPASARELLGVLDAVNTPSAQPAAAAPMSARQRGAFIALVVVAALVGGSVLLKRGRSAGDAAMDRSVAVLPFENAGGDSTREYFADGLTEELIGRLAARGLRVTGRNSVFTFKGQHPTPRQVGEALHVGSVLTGSVRRRGDQLHVNAELASTINDAVLRVFPVDGAASQLFALQRELVDSVEAHFGVAPSAARPGRFEGTANLEAYDAYLRGMYLFNNLSRDGFSSALAQFDRAIALDPAYAQPHVGKVLVLISVADGFAPPSDILEQARAGGRQHSVHGLERVRSDRGIPSWAPRAICGGGPSTCTGCTRTSLMRRRRSSRRGCSPTRSRHCFSRSVNSFRSWLGRLIPPGPFSSARRRGFRRSITPTRSMAAS